MKRLLRLAGLLLGLLMLIVGGMLFIDWHRGEVGFLNAISPILVGGYFIFYGVTGYSDIVGSDGWVRYKKQK